MSAAILLLLNHPFSSVRILLVGSCDQGLPEDGRYCALSALASRGSKFLQRMETDRPRDNQNSDYSDCKAKLRIGADKEKSKDEILMAASSGLTISH